MSAAEALLKESEQQELSEIAKDNSFWRNFWLWLLVVPVPLMVPYLVSMWQSDRYTYIPFVFLAVGLLVFFRSDRSYGPPKTWIAWTAIVLAIVLVVFGAITKFPWFAAVGFVILAANCLRTMRGPEDASLLGLAIPLLTLVRLPAGSDALLANEIQRIGLWISSVQLDFSGVPHVVDGGGLRLPEQELLASDLSGGLVSVYLFAFLACVLASWKRMPIWLTPAYLLVAVILAIAADAIRISTIAIAGHSFGMDLTVGWRSSVLMLITLAIMVGFLISFHQLIRVLFQTTGGGGDTFNPIMNLWDRVGLTPIADTPDQATKYQESLRALDRGQRQFRNIGAPVRLAFMGTVAIVLLFSTVQALRKPTVTANRETSQTLLLDPPEDLLANLDGRIRVSEHESSRDGSNPTLGTHSDVWTCESDHASIQVALSQPFRGWRELTDAYENESWVLIDRSIVRASAGEDAASREIGVEDPAAEDFAVGRLRGAAEADLSGYLFFSAIRSDGTIVPAPTELGALGAKFWRRLDYAGIVKLDDVMMLQMWIVSQGKLDPATIREFESDFRNIRSRVVQAIDGPSFEERAVSESAPL